MKLRLFIASATGSLLLAGAALAQTAAPPPISAERLTLAHELVQVLGGQDKIRLTTRHSLAGVPSDHDTSASDQATELDDRARKVLAMTPAATEVSAIIFADTFSEKELGDLIAFYKAPANQALTAKMSAISDRSAMGLMVVMTSMRRELLLSGCPKIKCAEDNQSEYNDVKPPEKDNTPPDPLKDGYDQ